MRVEKREISPFIVSSRRAQGVQIIFVKHSFEKEKNWPLFSSFKKIFFETLFKMEKFSWLICVVVVFARNAISQEITSTPAPQNLTTRGHTEAYNLKLFMDKVKQLEMIPEYSPVVLFAQDELYMLKWLRGFNQYLNVDIAIRNLQAHLEWREREGIDTITEEDWSDFEDIFPIFLDTYDKEGRPVAEMWTSVWASRKTLPAPMRHRLFRWIMRAFEIQTRRLYEARSEGYNVSEIVLLMDEDVYETKLKCDICLKEYINVGYALAKNYPETVGYVYSSNVTPSRLDEIIRSVNPFDHKTKSRKVDLGRWFQSFRVAARKYPRKYTPYSKWPIPLDDRIEVFQRSAYFGGEIPRDQDAIFANAPN